MKDIDYTGLRRLAKYDIGTLPIGSGYLRNADQTLTGYFTQNATPVTNAFVPQAISQVVTNVSQPLFNLGQNVAKYTTTYNSALKTATQEAFDKVAAGGMDMASVGAKEGVKAAAKESAKSAASKAIGAVNAALNVYGALHGGYGLYQNTKDSDTFTANDLFKISSETMEYTNGVAYGRKGGYDEAGVNKYVEDLNKANKISGITSGLEAGASIGGIIGSILPGAGTLIGSGIGAVLGAIGGGMFGHKARERRKRAIEEAKRQYALAADAYNTQNESEAASTGLRNEYYATHADAGKDIVSTKGYDSGKPNSLVGPDEVIGRVDKNGNIIKAFRVQGGPADQHGRDTIPAKLGDRDFVIGNKINPFTGNEYSAEAAVFADMFNNGNPAGELGLKTLLDMQKNTKRNNPFTDMSKYNCGKGVRKYADGKGLSKYFDLGNFGGAFVPTMAFTANELDNWAHKKEIDRMPVEVYNAYSPNPYLNQAAALMPIRYNIEALMLALNDEARFANYAINLSAYSPGQKMAMLSNLYNKKMQNVTKLLGEKANQENTMKANYAKWLSDVGAQEQQLMSAYRQKYYEGLAQASARKFNAKELIHKDKRLNWSDLALNLYNIYMGNKNIGLYEQKLSNDREAELRRIENNAINRYWNPLEAFKPYKIKSPLDK